jgi:hypothetical protein
MNVSTSVCLSTVEPMSETFRNETARRYLAMNYESLETFQSPSLSLIDFQ